MATIQNRKYRNFAYNDCGFFVFMVFSYCIFLYPLL